MLLTLRLLPLGYAVAFVALWTTRRRDALALSAAVFAGTRCVGWWAISRCSSTAGIGVIFLPALAAFAGGLVLAYGSSRRTGHRTLRALGIVALLAATAPAVTELVRGRRLIAHNAQTDADQARRDEALVRHRAQLDTLLSSAGGRAADTLASLLRARANDREFVLAALDCAMIADVAGGPAVRAHPDDANVAERLTERRAARCR